MGAVGEVSSIWAKERKEKAEHRVQKWVARRTTQFTAYDWVWYTKKGRKQEKILDEVTKLGKW